MMKLHRAAMGSLVAVLFLFGALYAQEAGQAPKEGGSAPPIADGWPQWRGNESKSGTAITGEKLARKFPEGGPQLLWKSDVHLNTMSDEWPGPGESSLVASDGKVVATFYRRVSAPSEERTLIYNLHPDVVPPFNSDTNNLTFYMRNTLKRYGKTQSYRAMESDRSIGTKIEPVARVVDKRFPNQAALDKWYDDNNVPPESRTLAQSGLVSSNVWAQGVITCVDAGNGKALWETTVDDPEGPDMWQLGTSALVNGKVYALARDRLLCLDSETGKRDWEVDLGGVSVRSMLVADGVVVVPYPKLAGYDAVTGKRLWQAKGASLSPTLYREGGKAMVVSSGGTFDLRTGTPIPGGPEVTGAMAAVEGKLVTSVGKQTQASLHEGMLYKADRSKVSCMKVGDKTDKWTVRVSSAANRSSIYCASVVYADGLVISEQSIIDPAAGAELTTIPKCKGRYSTPAYAWGKVFYRGDSISCFDLRAASYDASGKFTAETEIRSSALSAGETGSVEKLASEYLFERDAAAAALVSGVITPDQIAKMVALVKGGTWPAQKSAGQALMKLGGKAKGSTAGLVDALKSAVLAKDTDVASLLCEVLRETGRGDEAVSALTGLVGHQDGTVSWEAVNGLGLIGPDAATATLKIAEMLGRKDTPVGRPFGTAANAARALNRIGPGAKDAVSALITSLETGNDTNDPTDRTVCEAAKALASIGVGDGVVQEALVKAFGRDGYWPAWALARLSFVSGTLPASLLDVLPTAQGHASAVRAYMLSDPDVSVPVLLSALRHADPKYRFAAACTLGKMGIAAHCRGAEAALTKASKDPDEQVAKEAGVALQYLLKPGKGSANEWQGRRVLTFGVKERYVLYDGVKYQMSAAEDAQVDQD